MLRSIGDLVGKRSTATLVEQLPCGVYRMSDGIRYSNIEPDHDMSTGRPPAIVMRRPRRNQCDGATLRFAIATKLAILASDASRS